MNPYSDRMRLLMPFTCIESDTNNPHENDGGDGNQKTRRFISEFFKRPNPMPSHPSMPHTPPSYPPRQPLPSHPQIPARPYPPRLAPMNPEPRYHPPTPYPQQSVKRVGPPPQLQQLRDSITKRIEVPAPPPRECVSSLSHAAPLLRTSHSSTAHADATCAKAGGTPTTIPAISTVSTLRRSTSCP